MAAKWIEWIKEKLGFGEDDFDDIVFDWSSEDVLSEAPESLMASLSSADRKRRTLEVHNYKEREAYIRQCCEMMTAASEDVESQKKEYQQVTSQLADLDELSALPPHEKNEVMTRAKKIIEIEEAEAEYTRPRSKITEVQYRQMEKQEDEIPDILKELEKNENYQMLVRRDLNLLEGEKGALAYQRKEDRKAAEAAKNGAILLVFAAILVTILLLVLDKTMRIDLQLWIMVAAAVLAILLTFVFVSFQKAERGIQSANRKLNKAISLQNSVKIKYVNVTNLLDYTYSKLNVMNSYELRYMWEKYLEEREARNHSAEVAKDLEIARRELYQYLQHYHIKDPSVWTFQPRILVYEEDTRDFRHALVIQRQKLKKGIDFEMFNLENAKKDIEDLVKQYPQYAKEILAIVSQY